MLSMFHFMPCSGHPGASDAAKLFPHYERPAWSTQGIWPSCFFVNSVLALWRLLDQRGELRIDESESGYARHESLDA